MKGRAMNRFGADGKGKGATRWMEVSADRLLPHIFAAGILISGKAGLT